MANSGEDEYEEIFKLIFTKLYDEFLCGNNKKRTLEFRNYKDEEEKDLYKKIQTLFDKAKEK